MKRLQLVTALLASALVLTACGQPLVDFSNSPPVVPTVTSTLPLNLATGVTNVNSVTATFSLPMDATTLTSSTFFVQKGATAVSGSVASSGAAATLTFAPALSPATGYTATITTGAKSTAGVALAANYTWSFTTAAALDTTPPTVVSTFPADLATGVSGGAVLQVVFSEAMTPSTINAATITLKLGAAAVSGAVTYSGTTATFTPGSTLTAGAVYTATVGTGVQDLAGNALAAAKTWSFTVSSAVDSTPPFVTSTVPPDLATNAAANGSVQAVFSEAMSTSTISGATFMLAQAGSPVAGTVSYAGTTATFVPGSALGAGLVYNVTVTTGVKDLAGNAMASAKTWSFTVTTAPDTTPPTVTSTTPVDLATGVALNTTVQATFSEAMSTSTISGTSFTLAQGGSPVAGAVTYSTTNLLATFTPTAALNAGKVYTATVTTAVKDLAGNPMAANKVWTFTTVPGSAPTVTSTAPANLATNVPIGTTVSAVFSAPMDGTTITALSFIVSQGATAVGGNRATTGSTATFTPTAPLTVNTVYNASVKAGVKDSSGNALVADYNWSFTTIATLDTTPPTITFTDPNDQATLVPITKVIKANFSEAMKLSTMVAMNFTLIETATSSTVLGAVSYDGQNNVASFQPQLNLKNDTAYTFTVTSGAQDLAGNALVVPAVSGMPKPNPFTFRTDLASAPPPLAVPLGAAATYGIATQAGMTSTGVTKVYGDVAINTAIGTPACTDATGNGGSARPQPPGCAVHTLTGSATGLTVTGSIFFAADPFDNGATAQKVTNDLNTAWVAARAKTPTMPEMGGELSNPTPYLPGIYHGATSPFTFSAGGTATMDGQGDANAVFIFQFDTDFTDSGTLLLPTKIILVRGAQARNIFFVAGRDITIGSGTTWNGNILAGRTATVLDGSTVTGRVLAGAAGAGAISLTGAAAPSITTIIVPQ